MFVAQKACMFAGSREAGSLSGPCNVRVPAAADNLPGEPRWLLQDAVGTRHCRSCMLQFYWQAAGGPTCTKKKEGMPAAEKRVPAPANP